MYMYTIMYNVHVHKCMSAKGVETVWHKFKQLFNTEKPGFKYTNSNNHQIWYSKVNKNISKAKNCHLETF